MKKLLLALIIIPFFSFSQNTDCGEKPIKPAQLENQTKKVYRQSIEYINYKKILKQWKRCVSPLGMSERDEKRVKEQNELKIITEKFKEKVSNPCGDKPQKPKKNKGQTYDEYKKTLPYIEYKKVFQEWKKCVNPQGISKRNEATMNKDFDEILKETSEVCGEKPQKPIREKGLNHEEYKQTSAYNKYQENLKSWKDCSSAIKNKFSWGDCGEKPRKPIREEGFNHEEYKQTPEYVEYRKILRVWKDCVEANK